MFYYVAVVLFLQNLIFTQNLWAEPPTEKFSDKIRFQVEKFKLDNGLTVLIHEDSRIPMINYQQWFRVGSRHEKPGRTGLAHFFEHLMFKGTKKYPDGELDRLVQKYGGNFNAFTTEDYTGYYIQIPSNKLEFVIDIESDRMRNLVFDQRAIDSEREVVKEERRLRYENSIMGSLWEKNRQVLYKLSPYRWPVIGYMADLNATSMAEFKEFYDTHYAPNNAVIVVVGDVKKSNVKKLIEKYYGTISRKEIPDLKYELDPLPKNQRQGQIEKGEQAITTIVSYPGVAAGHKDEVALQMLASALGDGTSSRLYKIMVYKNQIATGVSGSHDGNILSGELMFTITFKPGMSVESGLSLLDSEIRRMTSEPISADELRKLKNTVLLSNVRGLQTIAAKAGVLAEYETKFGDYTRLFGDIDKFANISALDIQEIAKQYLVQQRRSIVSAIPKSQVVE